MVNCFTACVAAPGMQRKLLLQIRKTVGGKKRKTKRNLLLLKRKFSRYHASNTDDIHTVKVQRIAHGGDCKGEGGVGMVGNLKTEALNRKTDLCLEKERH